MFLRKKINKENILNIIESRYLFRRYFMLIIGLLIYSITYNSFFVRNNLIFGGSSSVATILKDYVDPSITILFISIAALLLSFIFLCGCSNKLTCTYETNYEDIEIVNKIIFDFKEEKYEQIDKMIFEDSISASNYFKEVEDYKEEYNLVLEDN